jgi:hypothetical protein
MVKQFLDSGTFVCKRCGEDVNGFNIELHHCEKKSIVVLVIPLK